ncbi:MAG: hypothetical protein AB7H90_09305 [Alphaproteobacteria bacterium]
MARTAVNQLQEQIEAIRREAFAAGFEAAMQSVRQFASTQMADIAPKSVAPARRRPAQRTHASGLPQRPGNSSQAARRGAATGTRPQRGTNARLVEEILQTNAPRALRPAEIRSAIQREKGVAIAFTSIRHALGQLESRRVVEQVGDGNTWRYREGGGESFDEDGSEAATVSGE